MGIIVNAAVILFGGLLGSLFKTKFIFKSNAIFGISVMLISAVGVIENLFSVVDGRIKSDDVLIVVGALLCGYTLGELCRLEERIGALSGGRGARVNAFLDAALFFGIGGLQICGPILLALKGDSSQLYLKSVIDLPFAIMFGAIYGKAVTLSFIPVSLMQLLIAVAAYFAGSFIGDGMLCQLCSIGYIILFFSGFNLLCESKHKIKNVNMIPSIFIIIVYGVAVQLLT